MERAANVNTVLLNILGYRYNISWLHKGVRGSTKLGPVRHITRILIVSS